MYIRRKRDSHLLMTFSICFTLFNIYFMVYQQHFWGFNTESNKKTKSTEEKRKFKSILLWNAPHRAETLLFGAGSDIFRQQGCEVTDCDLVVSIWQNNSRQPSSFDAIVFNVIDDFWEAKLPKDRNENQRYVFFTQESPASLKNVDDVIYKAKFNWTMTYRRNSDIPLLYGRILPKISAPKTSNQPFKFIKTSHNKTKLVAWMVSKCKTHSRREKYVKELMKYIQVDTFGDCGKLQCYRDELTSSHPKCYDMLESNYKFYLSFENSICKDYVTEKFFNVMSRNIVPVVFGGANYSRIAPPHSFIDARKFEPHQLAKYLKTLDANDTLYNQYFWWKEHYTVESGVVQMARHGFCDLCKKLHEDNHRKSYRSRALFRQWSPGSICKKTPDLLEF